ncbi:MAG: sigma-70 domain-containing protein [Enterocloster sp.]
MNGSCLRLPCVNRQEVINKYKRFCSSFQMEQGREPSEAEIALELWLTVDQVRKLQLDAHCMGHVCSLDAPVRGKEGEEDTTLGDPGGLCL